MVFILTQKLFNMFLLNFIQADGSGMGSILSFLPFILVFVVLYFFMIRPQTQKAKEQQTFVGSLKKGDKVITIGGIHGKITRIDDNSVLLEVENQMTLRVEKSSISAEMSKTL